MNHIRNISKDIEQLCHKPDGLLVINPSLQRNHSLKFQSMTNYAFTCRHTDKGTTRIKYLHQWEKTTRHAENPRVIGLCPWNTVS